MRINSMKYIKKALLLILALCFLVGSVSMTSFAEEYAFAVFAVYDETIQMQDTDIFTISITNNDSGVKKDIQVDSKRATEYGVDIPLEAGSYSVTDIKYMGNNPEIEQHGYGVVSQFTIDNTPQSYTELVIGVGAHSVSDLQVQYLDTIQKLNGEFVDYINPDTENEMKENEKEIEDSQNNNGETSKDKEDEEVDEDGKDNTANPVEKEEKPEKKVNHLAKMGPIIGISFIFAAVLYVLHKKNII